MPNLDLSAEQLAVQKLVRNFVVHPASAIYFRNENSHQSQLVQTLKREAMWKQSRRMGLRDCVLG